MKFFKAFCYESYKVYKSKLFLLFLLTALVINGAFFYSEQYRENSLLISNHTAYQAIITEYSRLPPEQAMVKIEMLKNQYDILSQLNLIAVTQQIDDDNEQLTELTERFPDVAKAYYDKSYPVFTGNMDIDYMLVTKLFNDISYIANYERYLDTVDEQAVNIGNSAIFKNDSSFSKNNISRTVSEFDCLHGLPMKYADTDAISSFVLYDSTDLFAIGVLLLLCILLVTYEKDRDFYRLLTVNRYGRQHVVLSKVVLLAVHAVIVAVLFYGCNLVIARFLYGNVATDMFVQNIPLFKQCSALLRVGEFLSLYFLLKAVSLLCIGLIMMTLLFYIKNTIISYGIFAIFLAAGYSAHRFIGSSSYLNYAKYINPFCFLDVSTLYTQYQNLNFFSHPVGVRFISFVLLPALIAVFIGTILHSYLNQTQMAFVAILKLFDRYVRKVGRLWMQHLLFLYELLKALFTQKGILLLLLLLAYQIYGIQNNFVVFDKDDKVYQSYIQDWGGEVTDETLAKIDEEQAYFDSIGERMAELKGQLESGEISAEDYNGANNRLNAYTEKIPGFNRVREQAEALQNVRDHSSARVWLIDITGYQRLFATENFREDIRNMQLALVILILLTAPAYSYDNQRKIGGLFASCKRGNGFMALNRFIVVVLLSLMVELLVFGGQCFSIARMYGLPSLNASIQSVTAFQELKLHLNILQYILLLNGIRFLSLILVALLTVVISRLSPNIAVASMVSIIFWCTPVIVYIYGGDVLSKFSLIPSLSGNMLFVDNPASGTFRAIVWIAGICLAILLLLLPLCQPFRKPGKKGKLKAVYGASRGAP